MEERKEQKHSEKQETNRASLSVIAPCFNEEENIDRFEQELFSTLEAQGYDYEVIAVDDGSSDKTKEKLHALQEKYPNNLKVAVHEKNKGLGAAVRTGINHASKEYTVTIDSDFTFHPKMIRNLFQAKEKHQTDFIVGSPTLAGFDETIQWHRKFLSQSCNNLYSVMLGKKFTAISPIFKLYKTADLKNLELTTTAFDINAEIMTKLILNNKSFAEIPAELTVREFGESKLNNVKEIKNHLRLLNNIRKWKREKKRSKK